MGYIHKLGCECTPHTTQVISARRRREPLPGNVETCASQAALSCQPPHPANYSDSATLPPHQPPSPTWQHAQPAAQHIAPQVNAGQTIQVVADRQGQQRAQPQEGDKLDTVAADGPVNGCKPLVLVGQGSNLQGKQGQRLGCTTRMEDRTHHGKPAGRMIHSSSG